MDLQTWLATVIGSAAVLAPIVAFLTWLVKSTPLSSRYYPLASVAVGVIVALAVSWMSGLIPMKEAPLIGAIAGGIASGLFMVGKSGEIPTVIETKTTTSPSAPTRTETVVSSTVVAPPPRG